MLNAFYATLFKPGETRFNLESVSLLIGLLVILVLALNTAGRFRVGVAGFILILLVFYIVGLLNLFWQTAVLFLCARMLGGQGSGPQTGQAFVRGLWPLLLSGVAIATAKAAPTLGALESFAIIVGTVITLTGCLRQAHQLSWLKAALCVLITLLVSPMALFGLLGWPVILGLGT